MFQKAKLVQMGNSFVLCERERCTAIWAQTFYATQDETIVSSVYFFKALLLGKVETHAKIRDSSIPAEETSIRAHSWHNNVMLRRP